VAEIPLLRQLVEQPLGAHLAQATAGRREALVATPGEVMRARSSSRPSHTRG
jgi:hypothetical protein